MTARQEAIRKQFAELDEAKDDAHKAEEEFKAQIADARHEAAKIREEAREQGAQIIAEARDQAQAEAERIMENGHAQVRAERQQAVASLRAEVGTLATELAGRIVGESLEDDDRSTRVVDRFLADVESMQTPTPRRPSRPGRGPLMLRGASAEARDELRRLAWRRSRVTLPPSARSCSASRPCSAARRRFGGSSPTPRSRATPRPA